MINSARGVTKDVWIAGKNERVLMTLHSHPNESPPSPQDLLALVVTQETAHAQVAEMVGARDLSYLLLRTMQTTEVPETDLERWRTTWESEFRTRTESLPLMLTDEHRRARELVVYYSVFKDVCEAHNIAVYTAPKGSTTYSRTRL